MKFIKKFFNYIFNPLNNVSFGKSTEKLVNFFSNHPLAIFFIALVVSSLIFLVGHNFF
jgi:hypothetical protein